MQPGPEHAGEGIRWTDPTLLSFVGMLVVGTLARVLVSDEPLDLRKLSGELLLALLAAVALFYLGVLQGLSTPQMMAVGSLAGLGGVRLLEWVIKIAKAAREMS